MKPDSIILDIDGTLWDSTDIVAQAWNEVLKDRPDVSVHMTADRLKQLFGKTLHTIADLLFPFLDEDDRYSLIDLCCQKEHELLQAADPKPLLYPEVPDTIRTLSRDYKVFIVSNCEAGYIELFLEKNSLNSCITDFECPGYTGLGKAENIRLVAERNHLKAPVYVGDTAGDQEASLQAGVPFCYAAYGFGEVKDPDLTIQKFSDLLTIF